MSFANSPFASASFADTTQSVVVSLSGVSSEAQIGTVSLVTDNILSVTGLQSNSTLNSVGTSADGSVTVIAPADQIEAEIGSSTIIADANFSVTGLESSFTLNSVTPTAGATTSPTGEEITSSTGTADAFAQFIAEVT
jgi:hypothetical protein